jgi:hypothetical protein
LFESFSSGFEMGYYTKVDPLILESIDDREKVSIATTAEDDSIARSGFDCIDRNLDIITFGFVFASANIDDGEE